MIEFEFTEIDGLWTLRIRGQLDQDTRALFDGMVEQAIFLERRPLGVDLRQVTHIDREGAAALRSALDRLSDGVTGIILITD